MLFRNKNCNDIFVDLFKIVKQKKLVVQEDSLQILSDSC